MCLFLIFIFLLRWHCAHILDHILPGLQLRISPQLRQLSLIPSDVLQVGQQWHTGFFGKFGRLPEELLFFVFVELICDKHTALVEFKVQSTGLKAIQVDT